MLGTLRNARLPLLVGSLLGLCCGCMPDADPSRPVRLVPGAGWSGVHLQAIQNAAESWNLAFGTFLSVGDDDGSAQTVSVEWSELLCAYAAGMADALGGYRIHVCPVYGQHPLTEMTTSSVVQHEIGHILGIGRHARDPLAVMNGDYGGVPGHFRPEDRRLFAEANPDFVGRSGCQVNREVASSPHRPMVVHPPGRPVQLLWAEQGGLRFAPLDPNTGQLAGTGGRIPTRDLPSYLRAAPTPAGFVVTWLESAEGAFYRSGVTLPGGAVQSPVKLQLGDTWDTDDIESLDMVHAAPHLVLLIADSEYVSQWGNHTLELHALDAQTGAVRGGWRLSGYRASLLVHGGRPHLLYGHGAGVGSVVEHRVSLARLAPVGSGWSVDQRLTLHLQRSAQKQTFSNVPDIATAAASTADGIVAAVIPPWGPATLLRSRDGQTVAQRAELALPGVSADPYALFSLLQSGDTLALAYAEEAGNTYQPEIYSVLLEPQTLRPRGPWKRLSAADATPSTQPLLAAHQGKLLTIWREFIAEAGPDDPDRVTIRVIKSRCQPLAR